MHVRQFAAERGDFGFDCKPVVWGEHQVATMRVVARRLGTLDAEIDRDQDGSQPITGLDLMRPGQADQPADFLVSVALTVCSLPSRTMVSSTLLPTDRSRI